MKIIGFALLSGMANGGCVAHPLLSGGGRGGVLGIPSMYQRALFIRKAAGSLAQRIAMKNLAAANKSRRDLMARRQYHRKLGGNALGKGGVWKMAGEE